MIPVNPKDLVMAVSPMDVDTFVYRSNQVSQHWRFAKRCLAKEIDSKASLEVDLEETNFKSFFV